MSQKSENIERNIIVLANASQIVSAVIKNISGNDISTSINGTKLGLETIRNISLSRMAKNIQSGTGVN
jgi:hypothetical protein